jgi:hypothetical protein
MDPSPRRRRRPFAWTALLAACGLLAPGACGSPDHPPALGDLTLPPGALDGGESFDFDAQLTPPQCTVGPEGGVCACVDQTIIGDKPNLYFVLDRSGSMLDSNKWGQIKLALADLLTQLGPRVNFGATVFPDPRTDNCNPGIEVFSTRPGDSPAGWEGPTTASLLHTLNSIGAAGGTPTAATLQAILPTVEQLQGRTYVILATDGGPNCNPNATCGFTDCQLNIESDYGCSPQGPINCCVGSLYGGPSECNDIDPTVQGVKAIADAGIPVYVMGIPGSDPYAQILDQLAQAGGTNRPGEPQYYAVDTADEALFLDALKKIAATITGTCTLTLDAVPPDPGQINVFFDQSILPQSGADGWTISGSTVTILGASCQKIMDGDVIDVRVVAGCPTVNI